MSTEVTFRHLSMLLLVIEKLSITQRMRQLRFQSEDGRLVGQLVLDGGMVSCGVWVDGAIYVDDEFRRDAAPISGILSKVLLGESISFEETARVQAIPLVARRALCQVTARALRHLSVLCDLSQIRIVELSGPNSDGKPRIVSGLAVGGMLTGSSALNPAGGTQNQALRFFFSPVDLLLAAGRLGRFRESDAAAKIYEVHPEPVEERWLFQWQASQIGEAWPVMTTRQSDKQTNSVAQFGLLGQNLVQRFAFAQRSGMLRGTAAELAVTGDHLYYVVLTDSYVTLLVYQKQQMDRVLRSFQDLVFDSPHSAPGPAQAGLSKSGPAVAPSSLPPAAERGAGASAPSSAVPNIETGSTASAAALPEPAASPATSAALVHTAAAPRLFTPASDAAEGAPPSATAGSQPLRDRPPSAGRGRSVSPPERDTQAPSAGPVSLDKPSPDMLPRASAVTLGEMLTDAEVAQLAESRGPRNPTPAGLPAQAHPTLAHTPPPRGVPEPPRAIEAAPAAPRSPSAPAVPAPSPAPAPPALPAAAVPPSLVAPIAPPAPPAPIASPAPPASIASPAPPAPAAPPVPTAPSAPSVPVAAPVPPVPPRPASPAPASVVAPASTSPPAVRSSAPSLPVVPLPEPPPSPPPALAAMLGSPASFATSAAPPSLSAAVVAPPSAPAVPRPPVPSPPPGGGAQVAGSVASGASSPPALATSSPPPALMPPVVAAPSAGGRDVSRQAGTAVLPEHSPPRRATGEILSAAEVSPRPALVTATSGPESKRVPVNAGASSPPPEPEPPPRSPPQPARPPAPSPSAKLVPAVASIEPETSPAPPASPSADSSVEQSSPGPSVLRIEGLSAEYEGKVALQDVDLQLAARGLYALLGEAKSGKSTLLGVLSGRHRTASGWQLSGSIWYCNLPLGATARPAVLTADVTRPSLSLRGYLLADLDELAADLASTPFLLELLERVGLPGLAPHLSETLGGPRLHLSTGEWRRLAIARELAASPPLLCLDDAFVGLSAADSAALCSVLQSAARDRAVLFTSPTPPPAGLAVTQTFRLQAGRLLGRAAAPRAPVALAPLAEPLAPALTEGPPTVSQPSSPGAGPRRPTEAVIWNSTAPILRLRNFGILASGRPVLTGINLDLPDCGLHLLIGRDGLQRRMLLRALCGPRVGLQCTGDALFGGGALSGEHGLAQPLANPRQALLTVREHLVAGPSQWPASGRADHTQRARRMFEQAGFPELETLLDVPLCDLGIYERRIIEILASVATSPLALALQDVLTGVETSLKPRLLRLLADQAARRAILVFSEDAQPYLAFAFTPSARVAYLGDERIQAEPTP